MSAIVETITDNGKAILASTLTDFTELDYEYEVVKNNLKGNYKRYGFISLGGIFREGDLQRNVTIDHDFQCILVSDFFDKGSSEKATEAKNLLFESAHTVLKNFITNKIGGILVNGINFEEPEFEDDICILRMNINVRYRYSIY